MTTPYKEIVVKIIEDLSEKDKYNFSVQVYGTFIYSNSAKYSVREAVTETTKIIDSLVHGDLALYKQPTYSIMTFRESLIKDSADRKTKVKKRHRHKTDLKTEIYYEDEDTKLYPQVGNFIWLSKDNEYTVPMLKVITKNNEIGIDGANVFGVPQTFASLEQLLNAGFVIEKVKSRVEKINKFEAFKPNKADLSKPHLVRVPKRGSIASLYESYKNVKSIFDYLEGRRLNGDIFLDQWMVDAYESSKKSMEEIEKVIKAIEG